MSLITMRQLLDHAAEHNYGVPAFNVNNMEQVHAIMEAADQTDSPVIMQASTGAMREICKIRYEAFGCAGRGASIRPLNLEIMSQRYDAGELEPTVH